MVRPRPKGRNSLLFPELLHEVEDGFTDLEQLTPCFGREGRWQEGVRGAGQARFGRDSFEGDLGLVQVIERAFEIGDREGRVGQGHTPGDGAEGAGKFRTGDLEPEQQPMEIVVGRRLEAKGPAGAADVQSRFEGAMLQRMPDVVPLDSDPIDALRDAVRSPIRPR